MKAYEILTKDPVTVTPDTPVQKVAAILTENRISGLPVVTSEGELIGIISQSDLLHRPENGTERKWKWWLTLISNPDSLAREFTKTHGRTAGDVMSRTVVSVPHDADLAHVADVLDRNKIKRVPVLLAGKLFGIITRGDLVRALAGVEIGKPIDRKEDGSLQKILIDRIDAQPWLRPTYISAIVNNGVVELWGFIGSEDQRKALHVLIQEVAGVRWIEDHLKIGLRQFSFHDAAL